MSVLDTLRRQREAAYARAKEISDRAVGDNRYFTADEQRSFEEATGEVDSLDERIAELCDTQRRTRQADDSFGRLGAGGRRPRTNTALADDFRSMLLENNPRPIDTRWEQPRSAYQPGLERRDLVTTAPANMTPVSFYDRLMMHLVETSSVLRAGATVITTDSGEPLRVPRSTADSTAAIVAEGGTIGESDPTLSSVQMTAYKYGTFVQISRELVDDSGVDLESYLAQETGRALGQALGNHLINGTGSGQPRGALLDATLGVTGPTGTASSFGAQGTAGQGTDLLYDLYGSVAEPYVMQPACGWLLRNATLTSVRKLKATTGEAVGGSDFVTDGPVGASAAMVGKPAYIDPFVPAMGASAKSVLFGDWSRYFVRMVNGIRFERSDDFAFDEDLVSFRALLRADAALVDTTGSIKYFAHGAS